LYNNILDYQAHIPGIYSSNLHGKGYSRITAEAIKGDYCKGFDTKIEEKYLSTNKKTFNNVVIPNNTKRNELRPATTNNDSHQM